MDNAEKELVRSRTDIVEIISAYTALKRAGTRYKGLCPFHQEKTPSFTVDPERGRWHCFGACNAGGDVFTFLERIEGLTFREALERLAQRAGIVLSGGGDREAYRESQNEKERLYQANALALRFFREKYHKAELAQRYSEQRGLTLETRDAFGIGYAPDDWSLLSAYLIKNRVHPEDAIRAGLIMPSRHTEGEYTDRFRGRLMFPIVDIQERVIGFGGRLIVDKPDAPKYLNSPETPIFSKGKTLYALNRAKRAIMDNDRAVLVEGYMDAVAAHQAGIAFVVATLGTALTEEHIRLLRRYTKNIILSFDADTAGVKAVSHAAELIAGVGDDMTLRVLALPAGEDPDSLIRRGRSADFREAIEAALTVPEFRLKSLEAQHNLASEAGRLAYLRDAIAVIAEVPELLTQDVLIRRVARYHPTFRVNSLRAEESVRTEVRRVRGGAQSVATLTAPPLSPPAERFQKGSKWRTNAGRAPQSVRLEEMSPLPQTALRTPPAAEVAERTVIRALLSEEWYRIVVRRLTALKEPLQVANPMTTALFKEVLVLLSENRAPGEVLRLLTCPELIEYVDAVLMDMTGPDLSRAAVEDALSQLEKQTIQAKNERIRAEIAQNAEGDCNADDEMLRRWDQNARVLRGSSPRVVDADSG